MINSNKKKTKKRGIINWTKVLLAFGILVLFIILIMQAIKSAVPIKADMDYLTFMEHVNKGDVSKVNIIDNADTITVYMVDGGICTVTNPEHDEFKKELLEAGVEIETATTKASDAIMGVIVGLPTLALTFLIIVVVFKYVGNAGSNVFKILKAENVVTFDDVAGMDSIKEEVRFAVDILKNYKELSEAGGRPTKGIILDGPPGTGKTLIAKAIAGEAGVPFINTCGSDFIEMFAGLGASRVRALWELAELYAPCVIFIDEIDSVGMKRTSGNNGLSLEGNQTINALLQKMDGLANNSGILVIAATNRIDALDPALLRPGRFDKKIHVGIPRSKEDRGAIIDVHLRNKRLADGVDKSDINKLMFGLSGAEIESSLNEAVMVSIQRGNKGVLRLEDIDKAVMKLRVSGAVVSNYTENDKMVAAVHEAGHAIMSSLIGREVSKVSIVAYSSGVGGVTISDGNDNQFKTYDDYKGDVEVLLAGKMAEELVLGKSSNGCSNDLERATEIVFTMVGVYGMENGYIANMVNFKNDSERYNIINSLLIKNNNDVREALIKKVDDIVALSDRLIDEETVLNYKIED